MTKYLSIIALCVALSSCGQPIFARIGGVLDAQDVGECPESFDAAWRWVDENIRYQADPCDGLKRLPEETYRLRYGDCEDFALLLACYGDMLGSNIHVVVGRYKGGNHCICRYNGVLIEPQVCGRIIPESDFDVLKEYSYEEALYTTEIRSIKGEL